MHKDWVHVILPFLSIEASGLDLAVTMDLAAGHGRNTVKLLALARQVLVVDINQDNLHFCRRRFAEEPRVSCRLTNGWSLPAADGELSFLYSWDAMVHFDSDVVRAYVTDAARALRPGGHAFLHHSNYAANPAGDFRLSPHQRNFCTQALMHHWAAKAGLEMVRQQPLDWAFDGSLIDCLTLLRRPT